MPTNAPDFAPVYSAVGGILRDQRKEIDDLLAQQSVRSSELEDLCAKLVDKQDTVHAAVLKATAEGDDDLRKDLDERLERVDASVDALEEVIEKRAEFADELRARLDVIDARIGDNASAFEAAVKSVSVALENTTVGLREKAKEFGDDADVRFAAQSETLEKHAKALEALDAVVDSLVGEGSVLEPLSALRADIDGLAKSIAEARVEAGNVNAGLVDAHKALTESVSESLCRAAENFDGKLFALAGRFESLPDFDSAFRSYDERIGAMASELLKHQGDVDDRLATVDQHKEHLERLESELDAARKAASESLESVRSSLLANIGECGTETKETAKDLQEQIVAAGALAEAAASDLIGHADATGKQLGELRERVAEARKDLADAQAGLVAEKAARDEAVASLGSLAAEMKAELDVVKASVGEHTESMVKLFGESATKQHFEQYKRQVEEQDALISGLVQDVREKLGERIDGKLDKDFSEVVDAALSKLSSALEKSRLDMTERMDKVESDRPEKGDRGPAGFGIDAKAYESGVYREGSVVQFAGGKLYKAVKDTAGKPGSSEDWVRVGLTGFEFKGVKAEGAVYEDGDLYVDGGSCFLWTGGRARMVAKSGQRGKPGAKGDDGKDGRHAPTFLAAEMDTDGIHITFSDGTTEDVPFEGFKDAVRAEVGSALEENDDTDGVPMKAFRGAHSLSLVYRRGDVVTGHTGSWVCHTAADRNVELNDSHWSKFAG